MDPDQINQQLKASLENREQKWTWVKVLDNMMEWLLGVIIALRLCLKKRKALSVWDIQIYTYMLSTTDETNKQKQKEKK